MIRRTGPYEGLLHEVVEHQGLLHIGGVVAEDLSAGMEGQAGEVFGQIDRLLEAHGSHRNNLLSVTLFVTDLSLKPQLNAAWKAWLDPQHLPARATIGVADLGAGVLLEVIAVAACRG